MRFSPLLTVLVLVITCGSGWCPGQDARVTVTEIAPGQAFRLENGRLRCDLRWENGRLVAEQLTRLPAADAPAGAPTPGWADDGGFALEVTWTGWQAPGRRNNAENPVTFTAADFRLERWQADPPGPGPREVRLFLTGYQHPLQACLVYRLGPEDDWIRRRLEIRDPGRGRHLLRTLWPWCGQSGQSAKVIKAGGFGQPLALQAGETGIFYGLEDPASDNRLEQLPTGGCSFRCGEEVGRLIGADGLASHWAVLGITPDARVKYWFFKYLEQVRVAPLKPYLLYNSWYDLRSPELVDTPDAVLDESNLLRIIGQFRQNLTEKYGLRLDAFVLDDGWDVYRSDWQLRPEQFPRGLGPIRDALAETGTRLGIWLGPIGGYSKRSWRLEWMKAHGYEAVGDQLCLAGKNYRQLFRRRVTDFVGRDGIGYFKWDGIQFSCSEPDHGHAVDVYSRREVLEAVEEMSRSTRSLDPGLYLNITSGTWLSPWWLQLANQIWMGGEDYGYAEVPSLTRRDAAITYRDSVLYEDFRRDDFWFPLANLMTHGLIKGNLEKLGGADDPLDKFTDDVVMYVARGVTMQEVYISPGLLTPGEWEALAGAVAWSRDRFGILCQTEMFGGDPAHREAYGYVHWRGQKGVVAARNPFIEPRRLAIPLDPGMGLERGAGQLVLERVYPTGWIAPRLFSAGEEIMVDLDGFETAVYEIYPLSEAAGPLLAGVEFYRCPPPAGGGTNLALQPGPEPVRVLNPDRLKALSLDGSPTPVGNGRFQLPPAGGIPPDGKWLDAAAGGSGTIEVALSLGSDVTEATLAILLEPSAGGLKLPQAAITVDGQDAVPLVEKQEQTWMWLKVPLRPGSHRVACRLRPEAGGGGWAGRARAWLIYRQAEPRVRATLTPSESLPSRVMPPSPWPPGERRRQLPLGGAPLTLP